MAELKNYVLAEMLWNPAQDPAVLIDEFLRGFYGADGAQYVRAHMDNVHRSMQAAGCNSTANSYSDGCLNSWGYSIDDVVLLPLLRVFTCVKGVELPPAVESYLFSGDKQMVDYRPHAL